jgi:SAM-dependent methyltransferase
MNVRQRLKRILPPVLTDMIKNLRRKDPEADALGLYIRGGSIPWSQGYDVYRRRVIGDALADESLVAHIVNGERLPPGFGVGVDERCIEYPWVLAQLGERPERLLDAGSTLNHKFILEHPALATKTIHIVTLAPETTSFVDEGISYLFADLRNIPIKDSFYQVIVCISTLEHVGCDNTVYGGAAEDQPGDFSLVMGEFSRLLAPGGRLFLTVPYGVPKHYGRLRQFDRDLLAEVVTAFGRPREHAQVFYRYSAEGWNVSTAEDCSGCEFAAWVGLPPDTDPLPVEPDKAAAARAVACLRLVK